MRKRLTLDGMDEEAYRARVVDRLRAAGEPYPFNGDLASCWQAGLSVNQAVRRIARIDDVPTLLSFMDA